MTETQKVFETHKFADSLGTICLQQWPEGLVLWASGEVVWKSWEPKRKPQDITLRLRIKTEIIQE